MIYLLQVSVVLAVLTLVYRLLLRREALFGLNRFMLWCNVVLAFGLPLIELPDFRPKPVKAIVDPVEKWVEPRISQMQQQQPTEIEIPITTTKGIKSATASLSLDYDWRTVIWWIYTIGVAVLVSRLAWQLLSLFRLIIKSDKYRSEQEWIIKNEEIVAPFSFFSWVFINNKSHNINELSQILTHERVHARQRHSIDMLAAEATKILLWFNPLAWWHQQLVQENLEFLTDCATLHTGIDRKSYQLHLLKTILSK
jgi:beta-lactamase regulating signal transducer with metallopeptidase domain